MYGEGFMYYIIYRTTNKINGKYYIGKHQTNKLEDSYLGSGAALVKAIAKYGKENFTKDILFVFDTEAEMNSKEKELVTEDLVSDPMCYNLTVGGEGGPTFKGNHHSEETKQKLREKSLGNHHPRSAEQMQAYIQRRLDKNGGSWFNEESQKRLQEAADRRRKHPALTEEERKMMQETCNERRSETMKKWHQENPCSEEKRKKLSDLRKGKTANNKGRICINNGIHNKYVLEEQLDGYLNFGWVVGSVKGKKK